MEILRASILACDFGIAIFIIRSFDELKNYVDEQKLFASVLEFI